MNTNGLVSILSVEDLGICKNERKDSFITLFVKEFGHDAMSFRMTAYGSDAEFIARNIITEAGVPYVDTTGIAGYVQLHSKEDRKSNKVKIKGRRALISGELVISNIKRDITGVKSIVKAGNVVNLAMTITADVPSTTVKVNSIQFIDKKAEVTGAIVTDNGNDEIDYEALADSILENTGGESNVSSTTGAGANVTIEVQAKTRESNLNARQ